MCKLYTESVNRYERTGNKTVMLETDVQ